MGARGGAVDLVGKHDLAENWALPKLEIARALVVEVHAKHVGGHKVGGELDAPKGAAQGLREGFGEGGFADAGRVFHEQMAAAEHSHYRKPDSVVPPNDDALHIFAHSLRQFAHFADRRSVAQFVPPHCIR